MAAHRRAGADAAIGAGDHDAAATSLGLVRCASLSRRVAFHAAGSCRWWWQAAALKAINELDGLGVR